MVRLILAVFLPRDRRYVDHLRISKACVWGVVLLAGFHGRSVSAQSVGFFGGTSTLIGRSADSAGTGYHVGGFVEFATGYRPLAIRGLVEVQQTIAKQTAGPGGSSGTQAPNVIGWSIEAKLQTAQLGRIRPYLLGGLGLYHFGGGPTLVARAVESKFGTTAGVGGEIQVRGMRIFGEVHHQSIAGVQILPISLGVRF